MSGQEDISWSEMRRILRRWAGDAADLAEVRPLVGGCINTTLLLISTDGDRVVMKISPHRVTRDFACEGHQLDVMRNAGMPVPRVYVSNVADLDDPHSYLLIEFMDGVDLAQAKRRCTPEQFDGLQADLANLLCTLHHASRARYQRVTPEESPGFESWSAFYHSVYDPIWALAQKTNLLPLKLKKHVAKLHDRLERLLAHGDKPRLVHWDIWATNVLCAPDAHGHWRVSALLDPNCKYAHHEAELAYMDLFHTSTPAFNRAYQQTYKLSDEYHRCRKPIYQLYPMLNHLQLFGAEYLRPTTDAIEKTMALA